MSSLEYTFQNPDVELLSEEASEFDFAYSQLSSFQSEPLDLLMKPWFDDGIDYPFRESVSHSNCFFFVNVFTS